MKKSKKFLSVFLALLMIISIIPMSTITASADAAGGYGDYDGKTLISGDYEYAVISQEDKTCIVEQYLGTDTDVVIPSKINGYTVIELYGCSFAYNSCLTSIVIPESVITIHGNAFIYCTGLTDVTIPDNVTSIGSGAFRYCTSLANVSIGKGVQCMSYLTEETNEFGSYGSVFSGCASLTNITVDNDNMYYSSDEFGVLYNKDKTILMQYPLGNTNNSYIIPDSVTAIGEHAFYDCKTLTSITVPDSVTTIDDSAFCECTNLANVTIGDGVTTIGNSAFSDCTSLTSITIPDSVTTIGDGAFLKCRNLTNTTIGNNVTTIGSSTFGYCTSLTTIIIPDSVTLIDDFAFENCVNLINVDIGECVNSIGKYAFVHCESLNSVTIPSNVSMIDESAFEDCYSLTRFNVDNSNTYYSNDDYGVLFNKQKSILLQYPVGNTRSSYSIPETVTDVATCSFSGCEWLTSISIPDSVKTIGYSVFADCSSLSSVTIPDSVTSISSYAFCSCASLTSIIIPDSVTSIGYGAFCGCEKLSNIYLGNNITTICESVFSGTAYYNNSSNWNNNVLYVDNYLIEAKYGTSGAYEIIDGTITIAERAFYESDITSLVIPDSVISICESAFQDCDNLTSVIIGNGVESIGYQAFYRCYNLKEITLGNSITHIGEYAFYNTAYYDDIENWENDVLYIGRYLIDANDDISGDYEIKNGTISIAESAFAYCINLTGLRVPESLVSFGDAVFNQCRSIVFITVDENNKYYVNDENGVLFNNDKTTLVQYPAGNIRVNYTTPNDLTTIGKYAFSGCKNLKFLTISDGIELIDEGAFYANSSIECIKIPNSVTEIGEWAFFSSDSLTDIYYSGTEEQWNSILIAYNNDSLLNSNIHFEESNEHTHTSKTITIPATCTVAGMEYNVCEICGETIGDSTVIPATGHTAGEWETVLEPTYEADGKKVKKCTVCGEIVAEEVIPMLVKVTVTDEDTNVSIEVDSDDYNGVVDIVVEESFDGTAFDVIDTSLNASQKFIYDITMTVDGVETQPNGTVKVKIPLPSGYDPNRSFVYHVDTETGKVEKMPATYEDGYMVFETTHFSYYAVVEEYNYTFSIQNPSRTEIRNKDGIILHANVEGTAPNGSYVRWESSNGNFDKSVDGSNLKIIAKNKGWTTFTAILCDADGNELARDSVDMYSKSGFFDKIGGFFRSLFGSTKIYEN